ncbi:MAG: SurA N-terminal domain-containing protein [Deltaproteobacteria bacterium]|nr:SurA N-terminal domain-containing protein [Deltaproteobacteria bacterium]
MDSQKNKSFLEVRSKALEVRRSLFRIKHHVLYIVLFFLTPYTLHLTPLLPSLHAEIIDKIIATVNQEPITQLDLQRAKDNLNKQMKEDKKSGPASEEELKNFALSRLIDETLLNQQIEKSQILVSESELKQAIDSIMKRNKMSDEALKKDLSSKGITLDQYKEDIRKQMKRMRFFSQTIGSKIKVSDEEVNAYYSQSAAKMGGDQKVKLAQIVLPFSSEEDLKKVEKEAVSLYEKVKSGKNFDQAMKEHSAAGSGDLGELPYSGLSSELSNAVSKLAKGQVSEPIKTSSAFLIVKLLDKPDTQLQGSEELKASLRDKIYEFKMQEEIKKYIEKLKKDAFIQIKS